MQNTARATCLAKSSQMNNLELKPTGQEIRDFNIALLDQFHGMCIAYFI